MKTTILTATLLFMSILTATARQDTKTVRLKVIETSDVHGHFFPYDFMESKPLTGTLVRANTYIKKQREQYGERLLLIDNGDILQGQPCVYWSNYVMPEDENLAASVVNYMKYDAETVGNHDIEPGHKVYDRCEHRPEGAALSRAVGRPSLPSLRQPAPLLHTLCRRRENLHHRYAHAKHPPLAQ